MIELFIFACTLLLLAGSSLWSGYVLSTLWGWFLVPIFDLPALSVPAAVGVALIVGYLTHQHKIESEKEKTTNEKISALGMLVGHMILKPAFALCFGWIVAQWL